MPISTLRTTQTTVSRHPAALALRRLLKNPASVIGLALILLMLGSAIFASWITPYSPTLGDLANDYVKPPSYQHTFGTDEIGRDIFTRVVYGARISLKIALVAQAIALTIGIAVGMVTGFFGGWVDVLLMRIVDIIMAFPLLIIAIALTGVLGASELNIILALGLINWTVTARIVRGQVLATKEMDYVTAARGLGATDFELMVRHILPNIIGPVIVYATLGLGSIILAEAALSFLGLGSAQQATPSWGKMLTESRAFIRSAWWMPFYPGLAILLTVLGFNLLGDGLRDALDVRAN
ncbi:MAG: ABC transporter permease [Anaerolineae bacterium]|nr:ABC transporter permease [Anaerolineae bacterium]